MFLSVIAGCSDSNNQRVREYTPRQTGEEIYLMYCAQCHGPTGDGNGLIELDRPARSFIEGGFSFGNTVDAISKTTRSGIPGSPMPPFKDILDMEQTELVAKHVRSLAPITKEATIDETEMVVTNRPTIVRGMLPPVQDGLPSYPRGVVIGNPDGFSYEYRADDVRLLAIRQGRFVQRTDWTGRGGTPLKLLGQIVVLVDGGNPPPMFTKEDGTHLKVKLTGTSVNSKNGVIKYDLVDPDGNIVAHIDEECSISAGVRSLVKQELTIDCNEPLLITAPQSAILSGASNMSSGLRHRTIIHAARESE
jgi:mono/diheme cytochrome c family protein